MKVRKISRQSDWITSGGPLHNWVRSIFICFWSIICCTGMWHQLCRKAHQHIWQLLVYGRGSRTDQQPPGGVVGPRGVGGAWFVCATDIFILNEIWAQVKICILGRHFGWNILLTSYRLVPVLAPSNKQHILSPAKVSLLSVSQHAD
jgi:hypothetical protein